MNKALEWKTIEERQMEIAERFKKARKALKLSREKTSLMSGVPAPTIRRFEDTGNISLYSFIALSVALDYKDELDFLYKNIRYKDIKDMIKKD